MARNEENVSLEPLTYHNELMNAFSVCRNLRNKGSSRYTRAVATFFDITLTSDRKEKAKEYIEELASERGIEDEWNQIEKMQRMKADPYKKGRDIDSKKGKLEWKIADITLIGCRKAMEDFKDFERYKSREEDRGI